MRKNKDEIPIFKPGPLRGGSSLSVSFVVSTSSQFTTRLAKKPSGDELGPARPGCQLCTFLSRDVTKSCGTFLKSQTLISKEILIIVDT